MPEQPDDAVLINGLAALIDTINAGGAGLAALHRLLTLTQSGLDAMGMSFVEYGASDGRVVAATGAAEWSVGRPVDRSGPVARQVLGSPGTRQIPVSDFPADQARQFSGRGMHRMLCARVELGHQAVGSVHAFFPDAGSRADPAAHAWIRLAAACAAHLYGDSTGLPVHGDGPVVAALHDGLAIIDRDARVLLWNPAAERLTGRTCAEVLSRPLPLPLPGPDEVLSHRLPDQRWLRITSGELPGSGQSRVVTFRDATDQYRHAHDRDLFIAVTSHELRTPVTVIKGYADTLANHWDSLEEADRREALRAISQRSAELARLVDRLLSSATDVGAVGGRPPGPFDLVEALRAAAAELPADLRRRLSLRLPRDLPKAHGDRASLVTVLTELVTNACRYSDEPQPVELAAGSDPQTVFFRVSDRGVGVRPEHVERAFDRFWQGEPGDRRRFPGAGLGLYLVRRIVERQNGWVFLRPRQGGGTVAEVRLPRNDVGDPFAS